MSELQTFPVNEIEEMTADVVIEMLKVLKAYYPNAYFQSLDMITEVEQ